MATDPDPDPDADDRPVPRNNPRTRALHAASYLCVFALLGTGWWLLTGREGRPSPVADALGVPDTRLHVWVGWAFAALAAVGVIAGWRAARTRLADSVRFRRGDLRWFARWPRAALTGRFPRHDGHFDPGQRVANLVLLGLLAVLAGSGAGLVLVSGGPVFVWLDLVHRWATYLITPVIAGHVVIASGVLPGYRGVWRAMHRGRVPADVARRLWPAWYERNRQPTSRD